MKKYLFYTPEGYTQGPNYDNPIENCQVLGLFYGENEGEAFNRLLKENSWITKAGFSYESIVWVQLA